MPRYAKWLEGAGQKKAIVIKTMILNPLKPNSGNRKCVNIRLSNGRVLNAFVPQGAHNLQTHSVVLVRGGRLRDVP